MRHHIRSRIELIRQEEGGRPGGPFTVGYCPSLRVAPNEALLPVRLSEIEAAPVPGWAGPGDSVIVRFELMYPHLPIYELLRVGSVFAILEGLRAIGTGEILADG